MKVVSMFGYVFLWFYFMRILSLTAVFLQTNHDVDDKEYLMIGASKNALAPRIGVMSNVKRNKLQMEYGNGLGSTADGY